MIAASHRNLREQVDRGLFREDLCFRLNVLEIEVAPLRNRPDDIEPLVAFFTEEYCKSRGIEKHFERATLPFLKAYSWPGNVRELKHFVESHLVRCAGDAVRAEDLDSAIFSTQQSNLLKDLLERHKAETMQFIKKNLGLSVTNSDAARKMGISPSRLQ